MKYVHFIHPKSKIPIYGKLKGEDVRICKGKFLDGLFETSETLSLSMIENYLPPVYPPNILALGVNYYSHAKEGKWSLPIEPVLFIKSNTSIVGHRDPIILPHIAPNEVDFEGELVAIIGRKAKNIRESSALEYVLGWTSGNDVSARDCQLKKDAQWARGKSFDTFCPLGPWIETDFNLSESRIRTKLNNRLMQDSSLKDMIFSVESVISYISYCMTILPGTIIMTGTPCGIGFARDPPIYLRPGDIIEVNIDNIGTLKNHIMSE